MHGAEKCSDRGSLKAFLTCFPIGESSKLSFLYRPEPYLIGFPIDLDLNQKEVSLNDKPDKFIHDKLTS
jgi:hypothetical protein